MSDNISIANIIRYITYLYISTQPNVYRYIIYIVWITVKYIINSPCICIFSLSITDIINKTAERIKNIAREVEIGKVYTTKVVDVEDFGIFVELWPGCEGLIHVSQLDTKRVEKPSDMFKVGDEVIAIATGYDKKGKLNLSRKELLKKEKYFFFYIIKK